MRIEVSIVINRPVEDVFAFTDSADQETIWRSELVSSEKISDGPIGLGSVGKAVYKMMGREAVSTWEITEYEENEKVTFASDVDNGPHIGTWPYEEDEGGTNFTWVVESEDQIHGLAGKLREDPNERLWTEVFQADLENLRRLPEA